jgi:hypothetical protein
MVAAVGLKSYPPSATRENVPGPAVGRWSISDAAFLLGEEIWTWATCTRMKSRDPPRLPGRPCPQCPGRGPFPIPGTAPRPASPRRSLGQSRTPRPRAAQASDPTRGGPRSPIRDRMRGLRCGRDPARRHLRPPAARRPNTANPGDPAPRHPTETTTPIPSAAGPRVHPRPRTHHRPECVGAPPRHPGRRMGRRPASTRRTRHPELPVRSPPDRRPASTRRTRHPELPVRSPPDRRRPALPDISRDAARPMAARPPPRRAGRCCRSRRSPLPPPPVARASPVPHRSPAPPEHLPPREHDPSRQCRCPGHRSPDRPCPDHRCPDHPAVPARSRIVVPARRGRPEDRRQARIRSTTSPASRRHIPGAPARSRPSARAHSRHARRRTRSTTLLHHALRRTRSTTLLHHARRRRSPLRPRPPRRPSGVVRP